MSYQIITDSCCDFTEAQYKEYDVVSVPLTVTYNGENHENFSRPEDVKAFYDQLRTGVMATTAAVNPDGWAKVMEPALKAGQDVLVMTFTSGMSTTYQSAVIAAEDLKTEFPEGKIYVVDSLNASLGQGLFVWLCAREKAAGKTIEEVRDYAQAIRPKVKAWFTVDDLDHLKRGGRISAATAMLGSMLSIKPVMHVDETGHLVAVSKARGRKASLLALVDQMEQLAENPDRQTVFISHGDCPDSARFVEEEIRRRFGTKDIIIHYVGPVIGSHTGCGVVALFFVGKE